MKIKQKRLLFYSDWYCQRVYRHVVVNAVVVAVVIVVVVVVVVLGTHFPFHLIVLCSAIVLLFSSFSHA